MQFETSLLSDHIQVVKLAGRLDLKGTNEINDTFSFTVGLEPAPTIVDMSEVVFLASIGIRMLISAARAKANRGSKMVLANPVPLVKEALTTAGFDALIPTFNTVDEAKAALKSE